MSSMSNLQHTSALAVWEVLFSERRMSEMDGFLLLYVVVWVTDEKNTWVTPAINYVKRQYHVMVTRKIQKSFLLHCHSLNHYLHCRPRHHRNIQKEPGLSACAIILESTQIELNHGGSATICINLIPEIACPIVHVVLFHCKEANLTSDREKKKEHHVKALVYWI